MNLQNELLPYIKHLTSESAKIIKSFYRIPINIDIKEDNSPVTIADKKAEEFLRNSLMKEFPEHGILGEEFGEINPGSEYKWVLDPIDGTKSFICGTPLFGTLIALLKKGEPILGVINLPILGDLLIGDNFQTTLNDESVKVRQCDNISEAILLTTDFQSFGKHLQKGFNKLASKVKMIRSWGDCYGYYLVATGYADIMLDPVMSVWDMMALIPVIKGAGGIITDIMGKDAIRGTSIAAASPGLHSEVISIII